MNRDAGDASARTGNGPEESVPLEEGHALPDLRQAPHAPPPLRSHRTRDAQAYARLLVSEIRLYHDMDVVLGRAARDLASRLAAPIDEARSRFRVRFGADPAFDREIVSVLAGGDARRLGSDRRK